MNLPKNVVVYFELEDMEVEAPKNSCFIDIVTESQADVTFGCRNGTCGTCRISIESGLENCSEASREEIDFLNSISASPKERLGCQIYVNGNVHVKYIGT